MFGPSRSFPPSFPPPPPFPYICIRIRIRSVLVWVFVFSKSSSIIIVTIVLLMGAWDTCHPCKLALWMKFLIRLEVDSFQLDSYFNPTSSIWHVWETSKPLYDRGVANSVLWQMGHFCHNNEVLHENIL
jgi:hypothetical protein